jgi:hypothetical protein
MKNIIFDSLSMLLSEYLGNPVPLDSGNGVRFVSPSKGRVTLYHSNVAIGNYAEVAFEANSTATWMGLTRDELLSFLVTLGQATGCLVKTNRQFAWPRIGVASEAHVSMLHEALQTRFRAFNKTV